MTSVEDLESNLKQIFSLLNQIADASSLDLILLPENTFFFRIGSDIQALSLMDVRLQPLQDFVDEHDLYLVIGGTPLAEGDSVYNSTILFRKAHLREVVYRKIHLFDVEVEGSRPVRESDQFASGNKPKVLDICGWRVGLSICYDLRFSELYYEYSRQGVAVILVPSAFLVPTGKAHWSILLRARAIESQCYVLAAAQAGSHQAGGKTRETYGHSLVVDPWGCILQEGNGLGPQVLSFVLNRDKVLAVRKQIPMAEHRRL